MYIQEKNVINYNKNTPYAINWLGTILRENVFIELYGGIGIQKGYCLILINYLDYLVQLFRLFGLTICII